MDALQNLPSTVTSSRDMVVPDVFPAGLRVLVVDDDVTCLRILEKMLWRCSYRVTTCSQASVALDLLREKKCSFDVVLSDVHMPDIDGFKLLELVGLDMDLPVIMMSADGRTSLVLRGIKHGACDYLIKPIREEELKNIWQHVVRKKWNGNKEQEYSSFDENDRHKRASDDTEYASSVNEGMLKMQKKRRDVKEEDDCELENDDPTSSKKSRVVWSVELHQQFVSAVNQLGIDKAVPKRILELMNVPGLTRENVASHLQKFRLYLKRLSGVAQQQGGIPNSYGRYDIQALAASGQIPPQTLAALHAELLGRPTNHVLPPMDQQALLQGQLLGSKCIPMDNDIVYGQPMMKCPSHISKNIPQSIITDGSHSGFGTWPPNIGTSGASSLGAQNGNLLINALKQQQKEQQQPKQSIFPEATRSINVQPSCLVVPSQLSTDFHHSGNSPASVNQTNGFNSGSVVDYNCIVPQSSNSLFGAGLISDGNLRPIGVLSGYTNVGHILPSVSSHSVDVEKVSGQQVQLIPTFSTGRQLPALVPNVNDMQGSYSGKDSQVLDQGILRNLGFVGKGTSIPSRFAAYEPESSTSNLNQVKNYGDSGRKVKQEPGVDFHENSRVGIPITKNFSPNECFL